MSSTAVFAKDFYHHPIWITEGKYACIDGGISSKPVSKMDKLKRHFTLTQNEDLIQVNKRLKNIESLLTREPNNIQTRRLKEEIHSAGFQGAKTLKFSLNTLDDRFKKANQKNIFTQLLVKIYNFFAGALKFQPFAFYQHQPIDLKIFEEKAITPGLELTAQERLNTKFQSVILNNSANPFPAALTTENILKLEYGLLDGIDFTIDTKKFRIEYDAAKTEFVLLHFGNTDDPILADPLNPGQHISSMQIQVKTPTGQVSTQSLQYNVSRARVRDDSTFFAMRVVIDLNYKPGMLAIKPNHEYTLPLSNGNLSLKFNRR